MPIQGLYDSYHGRKEGLGMAYSMALNAIYNQYLTTYAPKKSDTRYDTHKKSELRNITNSMAKVNRDAPLYKLDNSADSAGYIIGIKEETRQLINSVSSIVGDVENAALDGKIAYSTDESIVSVKYIGSKEDNDDYEPKDGTEGADGEVTNLDGSRPSFNIEVQSLAGPQVNLGAFLARDGRDIPAGDYVFDLSVAGQGYEFQYSIREDDTNLDIEERLSRLINNSNINLKSEVVSDDEGNVALRIESSQVGVHFGQQPKVFEISDASVPGRSGSVDYLGINHTVREASNANFIVNGMEASSPSNSFVLDKKFEVTLNGITPEEGMTTEIGIRPDTEAIATNISNLIGSYNSFIAAIKSYTDSQRGSQTLLGEMNRVAGTYSEDMSKVGINYKEDGEFDVDMDRLQIALGTGARDGSFDSLKAFTGAVVRKSKAVSLDPVKFVNKTVVEYKNPGKNTMSPYTASAYAGLLFNSYC